VLAGYTTSGAAVMVQDRLVWHLLTGAWSSPQRPRGLGDWVALVEEDKRRHRQEKSDPRERTDQNPIDGLLHWVPRCVALA
jgi:hypothetical protein